MWTIFKVFIEFVTILLLFPVLVFWPGRTWGLISLTRNRTCIPCIGRQSLNPWTTREVPDFCFYFLSHRVYGIMVFQKYLDDKTFFFFNVLSLHAHCSLCLKSVFPYYFHLFGQLAHSHPSWLSLIVTSVFTLLLIYVCTYIYILLLFSLQYIALLLLLFSC